MKKKPFKPFNFDGKCIDLSHDGKGVVKYQDLVGFIENILPDEEALIEVTFIKKDRFFGRVIKITKESPLRVKPKCGIYKKCGGCSLQHLSYLGQKEFKRKKVQETLKRIGDIDIEVSETVGMEPPYHYRNKIQMPVRLSKNGKIVSGFYQENTHDIVPVEHCSIENKMADQILTTIKQLMKKYRILPYDEDRRIGVIRHVLIRNSYYFNEVMVVLVTNCDTFPGRNNFVKDLKSLEPKITTIVQNINSRDTNVILGEKERILFGPGFIKDQLCGLTFKISPKSFYQVNPTQTEVLYQTAISLADIKKSDLVLDAYCGIGTIGLIAAKKVKKVIGVEIVKSAVIDAKNNAKENGINNISFFEGDAGEFIIKKHQEGIHFDVVIMDPPRKGSDKQFLGTLLNAQPKKIVYISCEPSTLARDLKILSSNYEIKKAIPVDMFSQTFHVETIVLLCLKDAKKK